MEGFGEDRDPKTLSKEEIRNIVKEAGIVGLGGAGFPTHVKLTPKDESAIDTIIVNGAECEPYLTSDYRMMLEEPEKHCQGIKRHPFSCSTTPKGSSVLRTTSRRLSKDDGAG